MDVVVCHEVESGGHNAAGSQLNHLFLESETLELSLSSTDVIILL